MRRIFVKIFETPEIRIEGNKLNPTLRRTEALLYYLAVNKRVTRNEVIELLWEGEDVKKCRKNLRNLLYKLKQDLGFDLLISINRETLIVNPDVDFTSDYMEFINEGKSYSGNVLKNFILKRSPKFQEWKEKMEIQVSNKIRGLTPMGDKEVSIAN